MKAFPFFLILLIPHIIKCVDYEVFNSLGEKIVEKKSLSLLEVLNTVSSFRNQEDINIYFDEIQEKINQGFKFVNIKLKFR
jgi:hypothetical protein